MSRMRVKSACGHFRHLLMPGLLLVLLLVAALVSGPRLATAEGLAGAIIVVAPLILATFALTPVAIVGHGIDLSVGPLLGFINVTLVAWLVEGGYDQPLEIFTFAIGAGIIYQLLQAVVIVYVRVAPIIVTLSSYLVLSGVNLMIMDRPSGVSPEWMSSWGAGISVFTPVLVILFGATVLWTVISRTSFFDDMRLSGADLRTAYASGVATSAARIGAHVLAGVFVGLGAITYTALIGSGDPNQGGTYTLQAATALVLGGTNLSGGRGRMLGSLVGAVNMYLITYVLAGFNFGMVSGFVTQACFGAILVLSLVIGASWATRHAQ